MKNNKPYLYMMPEQVLPIVKKRRIEKRVKSSKRKEEIRLEASWEAILVEQVIEGEELKEAIKEGVETNRGCSSLVFYTDS